jgi:hypothetical protein
VLNPLRWQPSDLILFRDIAGSSCLGGELRKQRAVHPRSLQSGSRCQLCPEKHEKAAQRRSFRPARHDVIAPLAVRLVDSSQSVQLVGPGVALCSSAPEVVLAMVCSFTQHAIGGIITTTYKTIAYCYRKGMREPAVQPSLGWLPRFWGLAASGSLSRLFHMINRCGTRFSAPSSRLALAVTRHTSRDLSHINIRLPRIVSASTSRGDFNMRKFILIAGFVLAAAAAQAGDRSLSLGGIETKTAPAPAKATDASKSAEAAEAPKYVERPAVVEPKAETSRTETSNTETARPRASRASRAARAYRPAAGPASAGPARPVARRTAYMSRNARSHGVRYRIARIIGALHRHGIYW